MSYFSIQNHLLRIAVTAWETQVGISTDIYINIFLNEFYSYHIKYMFVGDTMKNEVETVIRKLRPALQMRLRFITHLNVEQINTA